MSLPNCRDVYKRQVSALFNTRHRLLSSVSVVACNVHFPDEKLIKEYERRKVYVLRDAPDFQRNIDFIKSLQPQVGIDVIYNIDLTPLGRKSFDLLTRFADRKEMRLLGCGTASVSYTHLWHELEKDR